MKRLMMFLDSAWAHLDYAIREAPEPDKSELQAIQKRLEEAMKKHARTDRSAF
jgi:hypothetical protein